MLFAIKTILAIAAVWMGGVQAQSCFYTWGGVFLQTLPGPYNTASISFRCELQRTASSLFSTGTFTSTFTVTDPDSPSFTPYTVTTVITTTVATGAQIWTGQLAPASLLAASYVLGNCVLNYGSEGIVGTAAWVGPSQVSTSVGGNGLTTSLCPALVNSRGTAASNYMPTFTWLDCDNNTLPYLCAFMYREVTTVTVTVPGVFVTTTVTSGLTTVPGTVTLTSFYSTRPESTTTTTRRSVTTAATTTQIISISTATATLTATPSVTKSTTTTFTYYDTSFDIITVSGTDTVTVTSLYTRYTTTVTNFVMETFCSARETVY